MTDLQFSALIQEAASPSIGLEKRMLVFTCGQGRRLIAEQALETGGLAPGIALLELPCVGCLSLAHFMLAAASGVNLLALCPDPSCRLRVALAPGREAAALTSRLLEGHKRAALPLIAFVEAPQTGRLIEMVKEAFTSAPRLAHVQPGLAQGSRRDMLISALGNIAPDIGERFEGAASHFYDVRVDGDRCTLCGACAVACSEGALELSEDGVLKLSFRPSKCVGCYACEDACPEGALGVEKAFIPSDIAGVAKVLKASDSVDTCIKCGRPIGPRRVVQKVRGILVSGMPRQLDYLSLCSECRSRPQSQALNKLSRA